MTIHELITNEMKAQKLTPHKLAKLSSVDSGNVWRFVHMESGRGKRPGFETVMKLWKALGLDYSRLKEVTL